jgi:hypothetical protein
MQATTLQSRNRKLSIAACARRQTDADLLAAEQLAGGFGNCTPIHCRASPRLFVVVTAAEQMYLLPRLLRVVLIKRDLVQLRTVLYG